MTLQEFINKWDNRPIDFDGWYGDQCVDLMNQYLVDVCDITNPIQAFPGASAINIYNNANNPQFDKIANTPTGVPQPGDIVFWNIGNAGHVAVFISGDANSFTSFDQNYPTDSLCHEQNHDYQGVVGWLHFRGEKQTVVVPSDTFTQLVDKSTKYDAFVQAGYNSVDDVIKKVNQLAGQIEQDEREIESLSAQIETYKNNAEEPVKVTQNPVEVVNTPTVQVPITHSGQEMPPIQTNPLPLKSPVTRHLDWPSTIVFMFMNIKVVLLKLLKR